MERPVKIILYILVGIAVISLLSSLFGNSNLRDIRKNLEEAKRSADSALLELQFSKSRLDSIRADMVVFKSYINRVQKTVELNDNEKRLREAKSKTEVDSLKANIKELRAAIATDSLPDIDVITTKR